MSLKQDRAFKEFNKHRKILLKNIPPSTYEDVREYMKPFAVTNISISRRFTNAVVTLQNGHQAEEAVAALACKPFMQSKTELELYRKDNLLCITHLPLNMDDSTFERNVKRYGAVEKCFVMKFSNSERSKGYGFVEFVHNEQLSEQARRRINGERVASSTLRCDFVDSSIVKFNQLHSSCLLIDNWSANDVSPGEFTEICQKTARPILFKVGQKDGACLGFALAQYESYLLAEQALISMDGQKLGSQRLRASFCAPGKTTEQLYEIYVQSYERLVAMKQPIPSHLPVNSQPPAVATSPVVKRLLAQNIQAQRMFSQVLNSLHVEQQKQQTSVQSGAVKQAASSAASQLVKPDLQIAILAVMIAQQVQVNQPQFVSNSETQHYILNCLQNQGIRALQPSQPLSLPNTSCIAQANAMLSDISHQLKNYNSNLAGQRQPFAATVNQSKPTHGNASFPAAQRQAFKAAVNCNQPAAQRQAFKAAVNCNQPPAQRQAFKAAVNCNQPATQRQAFSAPVNQNKPKNVNTTFPQDLAGNVLTNFNALLATLAVPAVTNVESGTRAPASMPNPDSRPFSARVLKNKNTNIINAQASTRSIDSKSVDKPMRFNSQPHNPPGLVGNRNVTANPPCNIPGLGSGNSWLSAVIERQIRDQVQAMQQLNTFAFQLQAQHFQQHIRRRADDDGKAIPSSINKENLDRPAGPISSKLREEACEESKPSEPKRFCAIGTPVLWKQPETKLQSDRVGCQRVCGKRTLQFDDSHIAKKVGRTDDGEATCGPPLLPAHVPQLKQERKTPGKTSISEVPCSKLATGQIDDVVHGTDRKPVLPIVIAPTNVASNATPCSSSSAADVTLGEPSRERSISSTASSMTSSHVTQSSDVHNINLLFKIDVKSEDCTKPQSNVDDDVPHGTPSILTRDATTPSVSCQGDADRLKPAPSSSQMQWTPICWSRGNAHLLPSPEPSPDSEYIGQHSQGIGGHYLDSYCVKR